MMAEVLTERAFTPKQLENQRLFGVGPGASMPEQPGDKWKRIKPKFVKLVVLAGATGLDLLEGGIAEAILEPRGKQLNELGKKIESMSEVKHDELVAKREAQLDFVQKKTRHNIVAFVEDGVSDEIYVMGMNAILRKLTGLPDVSYPSATARFISNWTNLLSWTSAKFGEKKFWMKPWNFVNAVNVEAAIGLIEEVPLGVGKTATKVHDFMDKKLTKSEALQFVNGVALSAVTAINITKNMIYGHIKPLAPSGESPSTQ